MTLTTKTIINFLPLPTDQKLELLEQYDLLPQEEKLRVSHLLWELYYDLYQLKIQENFDKLMAEADEKGEKTDGTFYKKVLQKTREETKEQLSLSENSIDLSEARKSMEMIIREINAAKIPIKQ